MTAYNKEQLTKLTSHSRQVARILRNQLAKQVKSGRMPQEVMDAMLLLQDHNTKLLEEQLEHKEAKQMALELG